MPQVDPPHNVDALLIGTGEFSFSPGATTAALAHGIGYIDFGNVVAVTPTVEPTKEQHLGSYRGVRRLDRTVVTENKLSYILRCDEWNTKNLEILFGASPTTEFTQSAISAASGSVLGFTAVPAVIGRWYNLRSSGGAKLRHLTTVTIATKVEGTDFELDLLNARIRFLTAQAADLTPVITCSAITTGTAFSALGYIPLDDTVKQGFGRLTIYDQFDAEKIVWEHDGFSCEVSVDSASEIDGTGFTEITLSVVITGTVGTLYVRDGNQNAGI